MFDPSGSIMVLEKKKTSLTKAIIGGSIGNMMEGFDYGLYAYFATSISAQFFPSKDRLTSLMLTFIIFGVGFFARPLGGIIAGRMADQVDESKCC